MPQPFSALTITVDPAAQQVTLAHPAGPSAAFSLPTFELDGQPAGQYGPPQVSPVTRLANGALECTYRLDLLDRPGLALELVWRGFAHSPVVRLMLRLSAAEGVSARMTKSAGEDAVTYFTLRAPDHERLSLAEIQLSHFDPVAHSYLPYRRDCTPAELAPGQSFTGPVALLHGQGAVFLAAYEHGATLPDGFFTFTAQHGGLALRARKGNYPDGRELLPGRPFESVWFDLGVAPGSLDDFLPVFRRFFLDEVCINPRSRQPYIFYNTWNHQERLKYFHNRPYLDEMNAGRMLAEIDAAHRIGVDVFVIDTGWYLKTGDWLVNRERFPEGLREVTRRLEQYGMQLGLWFNPTAAAVSSRVFREHPEWQATRDGQPRSLGPVWETEESNHMCLASDYAADFVDTLARLHRELGVTYFKWDAIGQYGCDSPLHHHGTEANSPAERAECYAYELGRAMIRVVEELSARCPDVIVDFDVTEGGRFVGLGFLSVGKYFLVNNGPYFHDFDIPRSVQIDPDTINVFFYPGAARPRVCRTGARFDPYIPSILFLTHYLPDGPRRAQDNSLASLALGGNGIWGDLLALSEDDITYLGEQIARYKPVAQAATRAYPRVTGFAGSSPEVHEKLDPQSGSGLVAFFTVAPGRFTYDTQPLQLPAAPRVTGADEWQILPGGRLRITVDLGRDDARLVVVDPSGG